MVLELRPAHDPSKGYGFVGVVTSTADLSASVWLWTPRRGRHRVGREGDHDPGRAGRRRPAPADPAAVRRGAAADHRHRAVGRRPLAATSPAGGPASSSASTSATRARRARPARCGSAGSSSAPRTRPPAPLNGGPQMVEVSRDGRRVFLTNSLYAAWDAQFYPEGIDGWLVKLDAGEDGSLALDPDVFVEFSGERPHQVRLQGGDASSDSYCFPDPLMDELWPWALMALLGAYHGLNPAMGWLFAVALGHAGARPRRGAARAAADRARARGVGDRRRRARARARPAGGHVRAAHGRRDRARRVRRVPVRQAARALPLGQGARVARRAGVVVVPDVDRPRRRADGRAGADRRRRGAARPRRRTTRSPPCRSTGCRWPAAASPRCCTSARWSP